MSKIGEGVDSSYKENAKNGGDILWHVTIKGQKELTRGIPLHMSLKVFNDKKEIDIEEIKQKVEKFGICTPNPQKLKFKTTIFAKEKDNTKFYMLLVENTDKAYAEFYNSMKHCGTVYNKFMPHVTLDKGLYDRINKEGLKPEEIEFSPLSIEYGAGNTIHEFKKSLNKETTGKVSMQITPEEIDRIEEAGTMNGGTVKLVRTKGGFWIAIGRKKGKHLEEALTAGSHSAIVKYNMEKQFPDYQPNLMKSEGAIEPVVSKHSHFLSDDLQKSGHDIFSIQTGESVEFHITHGHSQVAKVNGKLDKEHLRILDLSIPKKFAAAMAGATVEKAISCEVGLKLKR